ncbi:MAG: cardiolipin synthase [Verrucomicrobiae bacterium]|nr:cardiolipin synthase [Verrucomicrobiae bacterium]
MKSEWLWALIAYGVSLSTIPHLLLLKKRPVSTLAWLWAIILFPYVGALFYLLMGTDRMKRKRLKRREAFRAHRSLKGARDPRGIVPSLQERDQLFLETLAHVNQLPNSVANSVNVLVDACHFYPALEEAIKKAKHFIHMQFYIWRDDEAGKRFLNLAVDAARRGVEVRILLDEMGCWEISQKFYRPLIEAGGHFSWFQSFNIWRNRFFLNFRNHRKLQIIDGEVAFVGGMNLGEEYEGGDETLGYWRDVQIQLSGPVVHVLEDSFANDWYFATDERLTESKKIERDEECYPVQVLAGGPDLNCDPLQRSLVAMLNHARERFWITCGYFVPSETLLTALAICASRGVDVRLLIAEKVDHPYLVQVSRSFYEDLLHVGVRLFEYSCGMNHSKVTIIDQDWLMVGSANLDNRSMRLNFELNVLIRSQEQNQYLSDILEKDFEKSKEIKLSIFQKRSFKQKLVEAAFRPLAPLL